MVCHRFSWHYYVPVPHACEKGEISLKLLLNQEVLCFVYMRSVVFCCQNRTTEQTTWQSQSQCAPSKTQSISTARTTQA